MLYIIGSDISSVDRGNISVIFGYSYFKDDFRIVDIAHEDLEYDGPMAIFCIGKVAIRTVIRNLIEANRLSRSSFVGHDLVDEKSGLLFVSVGMNPSEIMISDGNKDFIWAKVTSCVDMYKGIDWNSVESGSVASPVSGTVMEPDNEDDSMESLSFRREDFLDKLFEQVNTSDNSIAKSLSKYNVIEIDTPDGPLSIYPTNRIPKSEEGFYLTIKDLILLLKFSTVVGGDSIRIVRGN